MQSSTTFYHKNSNFYFIKLLHVSTELGHCQACKMFKMMLVVYCFFNKKSYVGLCYIYIVEDSFVLISVMSVGRHETSVSYTGTYFTS